MKRMYWIGDMQGNSGPAIVNKSYFNYLKDDFVFCKKNGKLYRIFHFFLHLLFMKTILVSGFSALNYYFIIIAKFFHKRTIYLMHGYMTLEMKYQATFNKKMMLIEKKLLFSVDKIICVSGFFCKYMKEELPAISNKFTFVNNGIERFCCENDIDSYSHDFVIISTGGGVKQKNNLKVCEAISMLHDKNIKYIVIGNEGIDGSKIKQFVFVTFFDNLPHSDVLKQMQRSNLYIQNSYFETFGLSILEAVQCGCDVLISRNIGVKDVLNDLKQEDFIDDNNNIFEIAKKIKNKLNTYKKHQTKKYSVNDKYLWYNSSKELLKKCGE